MSRYHLLAFLPLVYFMTNFTAVIWTKCLPLSSSLTLFIYSALALPTHRTLVCTCYLTICLSIILFQINLNLRPRKSENMIWMIHILLTDIWCVQNLLLVLVNICTVCGFWDKLKHLITIRQIITLIINFFYISGIINYLKPF